MEIVIETNTGRYYKKSLINRQRDVKNINKINKYEFKLVTKFCYEYQ